MQAVSCPYCGAQSLIDRGRKPTTAPPPQGMHVIRIAPSPSKAVAVALLGGVMSLVVTGGVAATLFALRAPGTSKLGAAPLVGAAARTQFTDLPMLADVNGDGSPDVIGKTRIPGGEEWIAAYDGRNGKPLWRTPALVKEATTYDSRRAVVFDRLISVDALGKVQAYDLRTGAPSWSVPLGEKARRVCQGDGAIVVETVDDVRHGLAPATGQRRELAKGAACAAVSSSNESAGYRIVGTSDFGDFGLPALHEIEGMYGNKALIPSGPGPRFVLGSRNKGSRIAMVAAVDGKKVLWKEAVPGVDPLTTKLGDPDAATYAGGLLVVPYDMNAQDGGTRLACFHGATGKRLWDVQVHKKTRVTSGITASATDVFYATWTAVYVLSLQTGQLRYVIGTEF